MSKFLVIGGSGVMGQAAIKAVREKFGKDATIIANWFGKPDPDFSVEGATKTIFGDISYPNCVNQIIAENTEPFEYMFYATALGEVGVPIVEASRESILQSNRLSFDPIPALEERLDIKTRDLVRCEAEAKLLETEIHTLADSEANCSNHTEP